ncbi:MAG: transposase [Chloroflexi bacterium]|nr:transposase [Chloroflexota bacterium]
MDEVRGRRSVRLQGYDYAQNGAYFVTLCVHERACLFGEIDDQGNMALNMIGGIVRDEWLQTAVVRPYVVLDEYIVMPNHFHAIIVLTGDRESDLSKHNGNSNVGATWQVAPTRPNGPKSGSIGAIVGQFKRKATIGINELRDTPGAPVWQRNYYEHVIRNESSLNDIRSYIQTNPARWAEDQENPAYRG